MLAMRNEISRKFVVCLYFRNKRNLRSIIELMCNGWLQYYELKLLSCSNILL